MTETLDLPVWNLEPFLPAPGSPAFSEASRLAVEQISTVEALFDRHGVEGGDPEATVRVPKEVFEEVLQAFLDLRTRLHLIEAYLECRISADTREPAAQASLSELQPSLAALRLLQIRLTAWAGRLDQDSLKVQSPLAEAHGFFLDRCRVLARHQMTADEESLAAEMVLHASTSWEKLHGDVTSQILVPFEVDGEAQSLPMSAVRNLAYDPDRGVRERAYHAEVAAWEAVRLPLAAAINSIKGEVNLLARRRKWSSPLEAMLFDHAIDRPILDAMLEASEEAFPDFRRYLQAKARLLGLDSLAWYDLYAPVAEAGQSWDYESAAAFIQRHFESFSPSMAATARRAFEQGWIDAGPRPGKVGGAFCMWLRGDESRILSNYLPTHDGMSTLAHELGHAYHNQTRAARSILQRRTPSTLAETASIFCETLVNEAAYEQADAPGRLAIIEAFLQNACAVVVDVIGRFYFEHSIFERRSTRALSSEELCEEMRQAQSRSYGDGLDPETYHPFMWAVKSHYYSGTESFYNYPYTFGLLFGLGLYAIYRDQPGGFPEAYEDLLSRTGMATADALANSFGLDLRSKAFWVRSLDMIRERISRFESLVPDR